MSKTILYHNKWVQIIRKDTEKNGSYLYSHSPWNDGIGVAILPFKYEMGNLEILGRFELCPAHSDDIELTSVTGGYDNSDIFSIEQCALNELKEEAGFNAQEKDLIRLGTVRPSKASDTTMHLFAVDVSKASVSPCVAESDGTLGEVGAYVHWVSLNQAIQCKDPLVSTMLLRLFAMMGRI